MGDDERRRNKRSVIIFSCCDESEEGECGGDGERVKLKFLAIKIIFMSHRMSDEEDYLRCFKCSTSS